MSTATRSASAERFAARARRRRLRVLLRTLLVALALAAVAGLGWLVGWSSVLSVQHVAVEGVDDDLAEQVAAAAEVPLGVPLIRVDTEEAAERVSELPEVGEVRIRRSWPQTLTIEIEPRQASAVIRDGQAWWSVDESGVLFAHSDVAPEHLPELVAPTDEAATLARATGVAVLTGLPPSVEELVRGVEVESAALVRLELHDGVTVLWGTAERGEDKARVLLALMERHDEQPSGYDVSAPDNPAVIP